MFSRSAAVTGIGMTELSRASGRTVLELAVEAARLALADAELDATGVDAVLTYHLGDGAPATTVARTLGIRDLGWHNDIYGGGTQSASILGDAAMLIDAGLAETVLIYRALNGRSGARMGQARLRVDDQFTAPYGLAGPVHLFALAAQRYLATTGLGAEDLAAVVTHSRARAVTNPRAIRREPLTLDDYLASPMVASPLRRVDCCQETDGACALVVRRGAGGPRIHAVVRAGGPGSSTMDRAEDVSRIFSAYVAPTLYRTAAMAPADVDVALLYDAYSFLVPAQLGDFGFCPAAEAAAFLTAGEVPVNPHGGLLSEGYVHGLNNVLEAVRQLRTGAATVALCTGFGGSHGSATLLTAE